MKIAALVVFSLCPLVVAPALVSNHKTIIGRTAAGKDQAARAPLADNPRNVESYGKLPLSFEANQGQTDSRVKFISRGRGYNLFLTSTEAVLSLQEPPASKGPLPSAPSSKSAAFVVKMRLVGANPSPRLTGRDELPGKSNYFIGDNPEKWRTNVPNYAKVKYSDVYPGVDLVYYGNQRQLEYDFVVSPGAEPRTIRLAIDGGEKMRIDKQGDLVMGVEGSEFRLHRPIIYQEINETRQRIGGDFVIRSGREVGFEIGKYDPSKPLIIDPVLSYAAYLGGSGSFWAGGIAVDSTGSAYVTGIDNVLDFPAGKSFQPTFGGTCGATVQCFVAFVKKLDAAGSALVYSTYLGGGGLNGGNGIAVDSSGNAYVTGSTTSTDFPTANAFQTANRGNADAFVTKLNATGSALIYSTYLGGSGIYSDGGGGIAVDSSGNAYVTGATSSSDFPIANAFQPVFRGGRGSDAFVTKLNAAGSALVYSTYLGGSGGNEGAAAIAVDSAGSAYVTGSTDSTDFPTANAFQAVYGGGLGDGFVTKLNPAGSALVYSTYLGGSGVGDYGESGRGIAVDSAGNAYVTGYTDSKDFPTANAFQSVFDCCNGYEYNGDAFVTKLNAAGSALVYSSHLGGGAYDTGSKIAVDSSGNAYVTGQTYSPDFPVTNPFQVAYGGGFVTMLNAEGSAQVYSTYLGGSGFDTGTGIAVDSAGNAYVQYSNVFVAKFPAVTEAIWQQAITAMKTAAGTDSLNLWQWAWFWQRSPTFPGSPTGLGVLGSIDDTSGMIEKIIAAGGGDGFRIVPVEQWVLYYRQAISH